MIVNYAAPAIRLSKGIADLMSWKSEMRVDDRGLGMDQPIARRNFLNGVAIAAGSIASGMLPGMMTEVLADEPAAQDRPGYYPPGLSGLRGSHPGSFEMAHELRDGNLQVHAPRLAETYDLVIVGGGISGLSAAYFYRERNPSARILILDNHDDFGGHAKRNEFDLGGRMELMNGGTLEIASPRPYSVVAARLLRKLGVDPVRLDATCAKEDFYGSIGLRRGIFFDRETFGSDKLVVGVDAKPWAELLADAPLTPTARADIARLYEAKIDYMPGLSSKQKKERLARMSYRDFLMLISPRRTARIACRVSTLRGGTGIGDISGSRFRPKSAVSTAPQAEEPDQEETRGIPASAGGRRHPGQSLPKSQLHQLRRARRDESVEGRAARRVRAGPYRAVPASSALVQADLDCGALVRIRTDGVPRRMFMPMRIAFRKDSPPGPAARSFSAQLAG